MTHLELAKQYVTALYDKLYLLRQVMEADDEKRRKAYEHAITCRLASIREAHIEVERLESIEISEKEKSHEKTLDKNFIVCYD